MEIKFRAWDKKKKKFIKGWEVTGFLSVLNPFERVNIQDFEVMQYVGKIDKVGREIYKDDILGEHTADGIVVAGKVTWMEADCRYCLSDKEDYLTDDDSAEEPSEWNLLEILGNNYQDKELLDYFDEE